MFRFPHTKKAGVGVGVFVHLYRNTPKYKCLDGVHTPRYTIKKVVIFYYIVQYNKVTRTIQ